MQERARHRILIALVRCLHPHFRFSVLGGASFKYMCFDFGVSLASTKVKCHFILTA